MRFEPVPASELNRIKNYIKKELYETYSFNFNVDETTGEVNNAESLFTPSVRIYSMNEVATFKSGAKL